MQSRDLWSYSRVIAEIDYVYHDHFHLGRGFRPFFFEIICDDALLTGSTVRDEGGVRNARCCRSVEYSDFLPAGCLEHQLAWTHGNANGLTYDIVENSTQMEAQVLLLASMPEQQLQPSGDT